MSKRVLEYLEHYCTLFLEMALKNNSYSRDFKNCTNMYRGVNEGNSPQCLLYEYESIVMHPEAEFLDVIGTKIVKVFLLASHSHLYYGFYSWGANVV